MDKFKSMSELGKMLPLNDGLTPNKAQRRPDSPKHSPAQKFDLHQNNMSVKPNQRPRGRG